MIYNYGKQFIDKKDIDSVIKVLKSDFLTQGKLNYEFENKLKKFFNTKYCTVVSNGTSALHMAVSALNLNKNSVVITSPISFLSSANCIVYNNLIPDFADIDKKFYTIDPNYVEYRIKKNLKNNRKVKAIIAVDYGGNLCDWESLYYLKQKYNLYLINDNCHAFGSKYYEDEKYAIKYSDLVTLSFHPVKLITTGEGGAVLSNNKKFDQYFKSYRSHGVKRGYKNKPQWYYQMNFLGHNYRLTDFQSALGISQMKKIRIFIKKRNFIAKYYNKKFDNDIIIKPITRNKCLNSYHLYPIKINFKKNNISKNFFFKKMLEKRINFQVHFIPIHLQKFYKDNYNFKKNNFPISEKFYEDEVSLPIHPSLNKNDLDYIINKIKNFLFK